MKNIKDNRGFFVIETMVVIAIVAIVITYVFTHFSNTYNRFIVSESYNNLNVTNAALNIKTYLENIKIDYETSIGSSDFIEISVISRVNTEYYKKLRESLNIKRVFLINTDDFFADSNNLNNFEIKFKRYLDTLSKVKSKFILVAELNDSSYGYMSIYNYNLELIGDASKEYVVYVKKGTNFQDPGYVAEDRNGKKLDAYIEGFVDINIPATYYLSYNLNDITLRRKVVVYDDIYDFDYTGNYQVFTAPISGTYKVELWGAQGGSSGGLGAYTKGEIDVAEGDKLYVYVGGIGEVFPGTSTRGIGGFNGGGLGGPGMVPGNGAGAGGGGATDIRTVSGLWDEIVSLRSRIMVAAGGGAFSGAGAGGGFGGAAHPYGGAGSNGSNYTGGGGSGGYYGIGGAGGGGGGAGGTAYSTNLAPGQAGLFGKGGDGGGELIANRDGGGGGGGGYYGGGGAGGGAGGSAGRAGGGSSFISGYTGMNAINADGTPSNQTKHFSGYVFKNTDLKNGAQTFASPSGANETGHAGNGYARITLLSPASKNTLSNVRFIYNEINGSTSNLGSHWVELQAYDKYGNNISKGLTSITASNQGAANLQYLTDGNIDTAAYTGLGNGTHYVLLDLGQEYDLSSIRLWHYYGDGRTYYDNKVKVAGSDEQYRTIMDEQYAENSYGKVIRPESLN